MEPCANKINEFAERVLPLCFSLVSLILAQYKMEFEPNLKYV